MPPAVCRFWQQGNCRNGVNCRFEHPAKQGYQQPQNTNRFGALAAPSNNMGNRSTDPPYGLTAEIIHRDLTSELPPWILSCYGPGRDAPEQLFGGPAREMSFEEVHLLYMQGAMSGNPQAAAQQIESAYQAAQQQIQHVLSNLNQATQYIIDGANKHPNRVDIIRQSVPEGGPTGVFAKDKGAFGSAPLSSSAFQQPASNPFGAPASTGGAFGQPSALGQKPNPFGAPAVSQPAQPAASAFGQPAFGQPAALGSTSPFGQPAAQSAFGAPSALGKPAFGQPAFGQSGFGQPATPAAAAPAFGQPSQPTSAFGQTSALGQKPNPFGSPAASSPFGATQPAATANAFGQPAQPTNAFGQPAAPTTNAFGQPAAPATNAFGQPATQPAASNPFGAPAPAPATSAPFGTATPAPANPFGAPVAKPNPFGQPTASNLNANPFGKPAATNNPFGVPTKETPQPQGQAFGSQPNNLLAPPSKAAFGGSSFQQPPAQDPFKPSAGGTGAHPDVSSYSSRGPDKLLRMWKGKPVEYGKIGKTEEPVPLTRAFNGEITRIWFPDGPPQYANEKEARNETEAKDHTVYEDPKVKEQWDTFQATGAFKDGVMPEVPPMKEYCRWDF